MDLLLNSFQAMFNTPYKETIPIIRCSSSPRNGRLRNRSISEIHLDIEFAKALVKVPVLKKDVEK